MASINDLATLAQVKAWIQGLPTSADDALLGSLISSASQSILSYLQRSSILSQVYTDTFDGYGEISKMLRHWPATSVTSLTIGNGVVPAGSNVGNTAGYFLQPWDGFLPGGPQLLRLRCWIYCWGVANVVAIYTAGYRVSNEAGTIPATPFQITAAAPNGPFAQDAGVVNVTTGLPMTKVTGTPAAGQYSVDATGVYLFNTANSGTPVLISYSYIPAPLNQACCEWVSEAYRYKSRIGERSHTVPGAQTVAFDISRLTVAIRTMLDPFKNVVPIL